MEKISKSDIELYIECIPGVVVIDTQGIVVYANNQCCGYFEKEKDVIIGKHIFETFPNSKMIDALEYDEPVIEFYSSSLGIGITVQVPVFKNGEKVGLLEYDVIQQSEFLYEFSDAYSEFLDRELKGLKAEIAGLGQTKYSISNIIGNSKASAKVKEEIIVAAKSNSTVLISGETGTGKELVAHAIHNLSNRRNNKMIKVNSSALPEHLAESELFGYEKGAFTGASKEGKKGKFEIADGGSLFIDEINQMDMGIQAKILRALQEKEIDRVGGDTAIPVDVRIIVATNENLKGLVELGRFRKDLYYRLNVVEIKIPPLRERKEDIEEIAEGIISELNMSMGLSVSGLEPDAVNLLKKYDWPGNVRELHNIIERGMNFSNTQVLSVEDLDLEIDGEKIQPETKDLEKGEGLIEAARNKAERDLIKGALHRFGNNKTKVAEYLGIARPVLYKKMKRLEIQNHKKL
ncbi:MAG: sigma 54-interacting transcriptional regulator [Anaerovoracaceae bacterium]